RFTSALGHPELDASLFILFALAFATTSLALYGIVALVAVWWPVSRPWLRVLVVLATGLVAVGIVIQWWHRLAQGSPIWNRSYTERALYDGLYYFPMNFQSQLPPLLPYIGLAGILG